ncbi:hypothetical protein QJS10_CPB11g00015 [Acorus calamus]|uniref:Uncharacterized protein n=1 Tax=Acorus calamus TaxID=4465 RepID=A0AAV9DUK9_ACOCL|nr:hypothetical protein QJS10_CPB11g00015 [Acorus calamus]
MGISVTTLVGFLMVSLPVPDGQGEVSLKTPAESTNRLCRFDGPDGGIGTPLGKKSNDIAERRIFM